MLITFSIMVFLAVASATAAALFYREERAHQVLRGRLRQRATPERAPATLRVERDTRLSAVPLLDTLLHHMNLSNHLELLLYQAGLSTRVGVLALSTAALGMGAYLCGTLLSHRTWVGAFFMALVAPLPYLYVRYRKSQRMRAFAEQFPDTLDLLVSALRAGLSFSAALQIVAEESPEPVRSEFAVTLEEHTLGMDFKDCLLNLCRRVDSLDLRFFAIAVVLQRESGGNLAEILGNTSELIRERFRMMGDIKTFTTQGRMTGLILVCLPVAIALFTFVSAPSYLGAMFNNETGRQALIMAGVMQVLGILVIRKIVRVKV